MGESRKQKSPINFLLILLVLIGFVLGCSTFADIGAAQKKVEKFHEQINAAKFDEIYSETAPEFKENTSKEQLVSALQKLTAGKGMVQETKNNKYEGETKNGATYVTLEQETAFSKGKMKEIFIYKGGDDDVKLVSYEYSEIK